MDQLERVRDLLDKITIEILGVELIIDAKYDSKITDRTMEPRVFLQVKANLPDTKTGIVSLQKGRKWQLSEYMIDDEIVKTAYAAAKMFVEHELAEGFKFNGHALFNHHIDYRELIKIAEKEVKREEVVQTI